MLKTYYLVALRNIARYKIFSLVTVGGLALGIVACFILVKYVLFEQSYDAFHEKRKSIFRTGLIAYNAETVLAQIPKNFSALGPALKNDFPEVKDFVRIFPIDGTMVIKRNNIVFNEENILFTDPSILRVFTFSIIKGDSSEALTEPYSVVITRSMEKKYFGKEDAIGKQLVMREGVSDVPVIVKAVVEDVPENSHITFDFLISHATLEAVWGDRANNAWNEALFYTYILLEPTANQELLESKLTSEWLTEKANWRPPMKLDFIIQPLEDIHLHSHMVQEARVNGNAEQVTLLWVIAILIIILAWINYVNLSTARYTERAKEVGVRKVVGASKYQLLVQFILESLTLNVISIIISLVIVLVVWPGLKDFTGKSIPLWNDLITIVALLTFFIFGSVFAAFFPSLTLSTLHTVSILKGKLISPFKGLLLRKSLVILQFAASLVVLGGVFIVFLQLKYMQKTDLGVNINQIIVLPVPDIIDSTLVSKSEVFKNDLITYREIKNVTRSTSIPGKADDIIQGGLTTLGKDLGAGTAHYHLGVDQNFIEAFGIKLLAGRSFSNISDQNSVIINETASLILGFKNAEDAIGQEIKANWTQGKRIIGVVQDFHQRSLRSAVDPTVFSLTESGNWRYCSIVLNHLPNEGQLAETISIIHKKWSIAFPGNPFDYFFLDEYFNEQYKNDLRFEKVLQVFSLITIIIACLGIFGLSIHSVVQRSKEIGIRKVLGASIPNVIFLFSWDYLKLIVVAIVVAVPACYFLSDYWLRQFAYHIDLQWWMFSIPGFIVLIVAFLSISPQSFKAALSNPTKSINS